MTSSDKYSARTGAESLVAVVDEELDRDISGFPGLGKIAGDLGAPREIDGPAVIPPIRTFLGEDQ
jgi:hypothetical protein